MTRPSADDRRPIVVERAAPALDWGDGLEARAYADHLDEFRSAMAESIPVRSLWRTDDAYVRTLLRDVGRSFRIESFVPDVEWLRPQSCERPRTGQVADLNLRLRELRSQVSDRSGTPWLLWIRDASSLTWNDSEGPTPIALRLLREVAELVYHSRSAARILLTGPPVSVQRVLGRLTEDITLSRPTAEKLEPLLRAMMAPYEAESSIHEIPQLAETLRGLDVETALHVVRTALDTRKKPLIRAVEKLRDRHLKSAKAVSVVATDKSMDDVGGLAGYKTWLDSKREILMARTEALAHGVRLPRGILLAGVPGCGKSLAAQMTAKVLAMPLLHLDVGKIFGKHLGDSEANLAEALQIAESAAPCVLWIDELDKALGSTGEKHEVTLRLVGALLTWLQERPGRAGEVLVAATANATNTLPRELLRRGRFDEYFMFGLPTKSERREIAEKSLKKINDRIKKYAEGKNDTAVWEMNDGAKAAVEKLEGSWSSADIEVLINAVVERAFCTGKAPKLHPIDSEAINLLAKNILPQQVDGDKTLRDLGKQGFRSASEPVPDERDRARRNLHKLHPALQVLMAKGPSVSIGFELARRGGNAELQLRDERYTAVWRTDSMTHEQESCRISFEAPSSNVDGPWEVKFSADGEGASAVGVRELRLRASYSGFLMRADSADEVNVDLFGTLTEFALSTGRGSVRYCTRSFGPSPAKAVCRVTVVDKNNANPARWLVVLTRSTSHGKVAGDGEYWTLSDSDVTEDLRNSLQAIGLTLPLTFHRSKANVFQGGTLVGIAQQVSPVATGPTNLPR